MSKPETTARPWRPAILRGTELNLEFALEMLRRQREVHRLPAGPGWGVARLDRRGSLRAEPGEGELTVRVGSVEGRTRGGQPVIVEPDEELSVVVPHGGRDALRLALGIAVDRPGPTPARSSALTLLAVELGAGAEAGDWGDDTLPLGEVAWSADDPTRLALVRRPWPLLLAAFPPRDDDDRAWLAPWTEALRVQLAEARGADATSTRTQLLTDLVRDWPVLTVAEVASRARQVSAVANAPGDPYEWAARRAARDDTADPLAPDDLPARLAGLVKAAVGPPADERPLAEPDEVVRDWSGEFLSLTFPQPLPAGSALELRVPRDDNPPEFLLCRTHGNYLHKTVRRVRRGAYRAYVLLDPAVPSDRECLGLPLTVSPLGRTSGPNDQPTVWVRC